MIRIEVEGETVAEVVALLKAHVRELEPQQRLPHWSRPDLHGERHHGTHRTDDEVRTMIQRANEIGNSAAAREFGVTPSWLSRVRGGHIWKHLTEAA